MSADAPLRRGLCIPIAFVLVVLAVLIALGTWQLERKAWKEALIAELDRKLAAPPADIPARERWARLDAPTDEFRRVAVAFSFQSSLCSRRSQPSSHLGPGSLNARPGRKR